MSNRFGNIGKATAENEKKQEDKEPEYSYDKKYRGGPNEPLVGIFYQTVPFASEYDSEMD